MNGTDRRADGPGGTGVSGPSLSALVAAVTEGLAGSEQLEARGAVTWARSGQLFAALAGDVLEVRLQEPVARAALRTPDTSVSARGEGWVTFAPATLDRYAADRARAWIESAWRHAAG